MHSQSNAIQGQGRRVALALLFIAGSLSCGPAVEMEQNPEPIVPVAADSPSSGEQLYLAYCASCHGANGKGGGPAAAAMRTPPTDLTQLASGNQGRFPEERVDLIARGQTSITAHGSSEMPVWGPAFLAQDAPTPEELERRISALVSYLESLQTDVTAGQPAGAGIPARL